MNINFSLILLAALILLNLTAEGQVKAGIILPLTGPTSIHGVPMKNAMQMAQDQLDTNNRLKLIFEDDVFLPRNTISAAAKLLNQDKIDILVIFGANQGLAVTHIVENKKIPFISINVNKSVVRNKKYSVIMLPSVEALTEVTIQESERRGYKKLAIIATQQDACLLQKEIVEDSRKFEIVYSGEIIHSEVNVREYALKIISKKPDAVFLSLLPPQGSLLARALREMGFKGDLFGGLQMANLAERDAAAGALLNAWVVSGDDYAAGKYYQDYFRRYQKQPTAESIYAYDTIKLILAGLETANLNDFLHNLKNFEAYAGTYSSDGENGFNFKVLAKEFRKDGFHYLR